MIAEEMVGYQIQASLLVTKDCHHTFVCFSYCYLDTQVTQLMFHFGYYMVLLREDSKVDFFVVFSSLEISPGLSQILGPPMSTDV
jgi:hypothetical protein